MANITLSKTNTMYQLAVNGWAKTEDALNLVVISTGESLDVVEEIFSGNDEIKLKDASVKITARGYKTCGSIERVRRYPVGGIDINGNDVLADVWKVVLTE